MTLFVLWKRINEGPEPHPDPALPVQMLPDLPQREEGPESRRAAFFRESMEEGCVSSIVRPRLDPRMPVMDTSGADPTTQTSRQMGLLVEDTTTGDRRTCPMT